jgi:hypothetical protein
MNIWDHRGHIRIRMIGNMGHHLFGKEVHGTCNCERVGIFCGSM